MNRIRYFTGYSIYILLIIFILKSQSYSADNNVQKIIVLVNEEIITSYEIIQRVKLNAIINKIEITKENRKFLTNKALEELIHEKLKFEKAKEYKISSSSDDLKKQESGFFQKINYDEAEFKNLLKNNNIKIGEFEAYLSNQILWQRLIYGLYYRLSSASDLEIDELISKNPSISVEIAENLVIQRQLDLKSNKLLQDMLNEATIEYK